MKRIIQRLTLILIIVMIYANGYAVEISCHYELGSFDFITLENGCETIESRDMHDMGDRNYNVPKLPWFYVEVEIPDGQTYDSHYDISDWNLCRSEFVPVINERPFTTDISLEDIAMPTIKNYSGIYPENPIQYVGMKTIQEKRVARFIVCPFRYDGSSRLLDFSSDIKLGVTLKADIEMPSTRMASHSPSLRLPNIIESRLSYRGNVDYIIITDSSLASAFMPLIRWKRKKGLNADIILLDQIYTAYGGSNKPLSIKKCIQDLHHHRKLQYVLLGGNSAIVPIQLCFSPTEVTIDNSNTITTIGHEIPTDLFYSNMGGSFSWDDNNNGIIGECSDGVDFVPTLNVSRVPIQTMEAATAFVNKVINYESGSFKKGWKHRMLIAGCASDTNTRNDHPEWMTDRFHWDTLMYNKSIKPYWNGTVDRAGENFYKLDYYPGIFKMKPIEFSRLMENDYSYIFMNTHGSEKTWTLLHCLYKVDHVKQLSNPGLTIISSMACHTNNYGDSRVGAPLSRIIGGEVSFFSLAGAFLSNPNYGAFAYLGNTREGLYSKNYDKLSVSALLESIVFSHLFSFDLKTRRLASCLNQVRKEFSMHDYENDPYRFLLFSLNLSGDPETELYTAPPQRFINPEVNNMADKSVACVDAKIYDSKIRVGYLNNQGIYEFEDPELLPGNMNYRLHKFRPKTSSFIIAIHHDGYIPSIYHYQMNTRRIGDTVFLREPIYEEDMEITATHVVIGNSTVENASVSIKGGTTSIQANDVAILPGTIFNKGCTVVVNR